ncbi:MAG: BON domain-containing protein [Pseudomonadota bacterium]|nr:BON domain-containing protein [Pseudomonadota bacterium]
MLTLLTILVLLSGCDQSPFMVESKAVRMQRLRSSLHRYDPIYLVASHSQERPALPKKSIRTYPKDPQNLAHLVQSNLMKDPITQRYRLKTVSYFGNVLVVGEVAKSQDRDHAEEIISSTAGVKHYYLHIEAKPQLSTKQHISDSAVRTSIKAKLAKLPIPSTHLQIIVRDKKVFILGTLSKNDEATIHRNILGYYGIRDIQFA